MIVSDNVIIEKYFLQGKSGEDGMDGNPGPRGDAVSTKTVIFMTLISSRST